MLPATVHERRTRWWLPMNAGGSRRPLTARGRGGVTCRRDGNLFDTAALTNGAAQDSQISRIGTMPWMPVDLTGRTFGNVTVESYAGRSSGKRPRPQWVCVCKCGRRRTILGSNLKHLKETHQCYCNSPGEHPQRRAGLAMGWQRVSGELNGELRFWLGVRSSKHGCWEWQRCRTPDGYGQIVVERVRWIAHRYSWQLHFGVIPDGLFVCHRCDNPSCVRPDHLFLGTHKDNMRDMVSKGRRGVRIGRPGRLNPNSKLTDEMVTQIIARARRGERSVHIAADYGVSHWTIEKIRQGLSWKHLSI